MTVVNTTTLTFTAGGWDKLVEDVTKSKAILERHGAKNVRLLVPVSGPMGAGTAVTTLEADTHADMGKIMDAIFADPDMIAMMMSTEGATSWTASTFIDIPL